MPCPINARLGVDFTQVAQIDLDVSRTQGPNVHVRLRRHGPRSGSFQLGARTRLRQATISSRAGLCDATQMTKPQTS